ncbi:MAG: glycosyl hydrolase 53 family protein [Prevotella sp.]|nr:glycosyl hydrolase 53 family protein [Prevotella sp.]
MNIRKHLFVITFAACCLSTQAQSFVRGADVSWCTEMEADGKKFYDANGTETELMQLLRLSGLNAVRLRVWVNPEKAYGAWSDKADVLAKARRAKAQGLDVMIDFHYSDFFADPGQQTKPQAWAGMTMAQLKQAVGDHTTDVLQALKAEGIEPRWVQVGNETRPGMIFNEGKIDWSKSGEAAWSGYVSLSNAGYEAVKAVLPGAQVIVHIDRGPEDNAWFFRDFKQYGGKFDMIGLSHYPDYTNWATDNTNTAKRVKSLYSQFAVPVMIVETGYDAWDENRAYSVMKDFFDKTEGITGCAGIFYWEPEVYGSWRPAYYKTLGWNAYNKGAFTTQGRPSKALLPFDGGTDGIDTPVSDPKLSACFDLQGRPVDQPKRHSVYIQDHRKMTAIY